MNEDLGVAQAEFFYDQTNASSKTDTCWPQWSPCPAGLKWTTYKENTLWNLRWRARMTRYKSPTNVDVNVLTRTISPMTDYTAGVGPFNDSVGMGPKLINSTAVKDATGEAGFIGAGPAIIH
jgi:hypothetical protein